MIEAYKKLWINFFNFSGRSTRSDYWYVVLANLLIGFVLGLIPKLEILSTIYTVITFIPGLALIIRRFHDINRSGWNYLWLFVPVVGWVIFIVFLCKASVNENNKYGERV